MNVSRSVNGTSAFTIFLYRVIFQFCALHAFRLFTVVILQDFIAEAVVEKH